MDFPDQMAIPLSRTKLILMLLGAAVFIALGLAVFAMSDATFASLYPHRSSAGVRGAGLVSALFFGLCALVGMRKLLDTRPGLTFNAAGMIDNSSGTGIGFVPWSDITGSQICTMGRYRYVVVKLANPEKYLHAGGRARQLLSRMNVQVCGSPIALSSNTLAIDFDDLAGSFDHYFQKYRDTHPISLSPKDITPPQPRKWIGYAVNVPLGIAAMIATIWCLRHGYLSFNANDDWQPKIIMAGLIAPFIAVLFAIIAFFYRNNRSS
jgi:hypothetical protein